MDRLPSIRPDRIATFRPGPLCQAMIASRRLPYVYIQNWKCGCSTIKSTLWNIEHSRGLSIAPGYPHLPGEDGPFVADQTRWEHVEREFVFTIVRNPYARVLSSYLDQIAQSRNEHAWGRFASRHGLSDTIPSFNQFLRLLSQTPHAEMNAHWRPQYCSVAPNLVPYDLIGSMESFADDLRHAITRIFGQDARLHTVAGHRTDAGARLGAYYGPAELALVQQIYEEDFRSLGYSMDPAVQVRSAELGRPDPGPLRAWGRANRLLQSLQLDAALADLRSVRTHVLGPTLDDRLLQCSRTAAEAGTRLISPSGIELIERDGGIAGADADLWKRYAQTLRTMHRYEDGLAAGIRAARLRTPGARRDMRLRHAHARLALLRASKGQATRAVAVWAAEPTSARRTNELHRRICDRLAAGLLRMLAAAAWLLGASWWHPDRSTGTPCLGGHALGQHHEIEMADAKA